MPSSNVIYGRGVGSYIIMGLLYLVWLHSIRRDTRMRTEYVKMRAIRLSSVFHPEWPIII